MNYSKLCLDRSDEFFVEGNNASRLKGQKNGHGFVKEEFPFVMSTFKEKIPKEIMAGWEAGQT